MFRAPGFHDGRKQWRGDNGDFNKYQRQGSPEAEEADDFGANIDALLAERSEAKAVRDYPVADAIKDRLREEFNVLVDDKARTWTVGYDNHSTRGRQVRSGGGREERSDVADTSLFVVHFAR